MAVVLVSLHSGTPALEVHRT
jgi:hypothetical protein